MANTVAKEALEKYRYASEYFIALNLPIQSYLWLSCQCSGGFQRARKGDSIDRREVRNEGSREEIEDDCQEEVLYDTTLTVN